MVNLVKTDFDNLYEELSFLYEELTNVKVKDKDYNFVTKFMSQAESEALYNTNLLKSPGIYIFEYIPTPDDEKQFIRYYVGKATKLQDRIAAHWGMRKRDSIALHAAMREHGAKNFKVAIIETCPEAETSKEEKTWIDKLKTFASAYDYNLTPGGEGGLQSIKLLQKCINKLGKILQQHLNSILKLLKNEA